MNSKLGEEQKKNNRKVITFVEVLISTQILDNKQKEGQNDNGLIPYSAEYQLMPYYSAEYSNSTLHIPT